MSAPEMVYAYCDTCKKPVPTGLVINPESLKTASVRDNTTTCSASESSSSPCWLSPAVTKWAICLRPWPTSTISFMRCPAPSVPWHGHWKLKSNSTA